MRRKKEMISKLCENCGQIFEFKNTKRNKNRLYCSSFCAKSSNGKNNIGKKRTDDFKIKLSERTSGTKNPFYGKKHTNEAKQKIKAKNSRTLIEKCGEEKANLIKAKISESQIGNKNHFYGRKHTNEARQKMGRDVSGDKNPMFGKGHLLKGEKNGSWKNGISFQDYGTEFTIDLKTNIRKRDKFLCQVCGKNGYVVHHIDYNKKNNNEKNLITVCSSCHGKTGFNRNQWEIFFQSILNEKYNYE